MSRKGRVENVKPLKTEREIEEMRDALSLTYNPQRNRMLFDIGINTGLRISDIVKLRVEDVYGKSSIEVREGKTQKKRTVYLGMMMVEISEYVDFLRGEGRKENTGYLFKSRRGDGHISTTQAYRILRTAGDMCGYDYIGSHTLRKTFGYFYYKRTGDLAKLMQIFNHDSMGVTLKYLDIIDEEIVDSLKGFKL